MKLTKFVHSCLLVETDELSVLIDPGKFSWQSQLLKPNKLERLDFLVITHEHSDHFHPPAIHELTTRFPHAPIVTNNDLAEKIKELNLPNQIITGSQENLEVFEAPHEALPLNQPAPLNIGVHIAGRLTHSGDALHIRASRDILALTITAPWTSPKNYLDQVLELKPKTVLPMHDWLWHKAGREYIYEMCGRLLKPYGVDFIDLENGETVEL